MEEHATGVLIAIDWENIRRGALMYQVEVTPQAVAQAMIAVGRIFGEMLGGKAFGDWSLRPEDGRADKRQLILPACCLTEECYRKERFT